MEISSGNEGRFPQAPINLSNIVGRLQWYLQRGFVNPL